MNSALAKQLNASNPALLKKAGTLATINNEFRSMQTIDMSDYNKMVPRTL